MTAATTEHLSKDSDIKHDTAKKWLQRQLKKKISRPFLHSNQEDTGVQRDSSLKRPFTAPARVVSPDPENELPIPPMPNVDQIVQQSPLQRQSMQDNNVGREDNAWLDTSIQSSSPRLMQGLSYWREAAHPIHEVSRKVQHAVPITREAHAELSSTSHCRYARPFRCRAPKVQVRMPSVRRNRIQDAEVRKKINRRSASAPIMAVSYRDVQDGAPPKFYVPDRTFTRVTTPSARSSTPVQPMDQALSAEQEQSHDGLGHSDRTNERSHGILMEWRINLILRAIPSRAGSTRPTTATASLVRGDSVGALSDAPTYFTGPPPPSYRSRTASILTTSSFGCVDGLTPAQRQLSQQKAAARRRGMKEKLRKLVRNFNV